MVTYGEDLSRAIGLERFSVVWMVVEGVAALGAGIAAHSLALTGFGGDSLIELLSAGVLLRRLELQRQGADPALVEESEHRAERIAGVLLALLAVYLMVSAVFEWFGPSRIKPSALGLAISGLSAVLMPLLGRAKSRLGTTLASPALKVDAVESWVCAYMAWAALASTVAVGLFGWTWVDATASLFIAFWVAREAIEAWRGEDECAEADH
ncbi:MAG: cation transporter [Thermaerobacter sp.]|nr:cation transporter [Thermaerobacter sp.]